MRILYTCCPLYGHVNAVLPSALAAVRAGHDVVMASGADMLGHIERRGIAAWAAGPTHADAGGNTQASWLEYFGTTALPRAADLARRTGTWQPDVVIADETELAGAAVAAACGARLVVHGLGIMPPARLWPMLRAGIERAAGHIGAQAGIESTLQLATYWCRCRPELQPAGRSI